MKYDQMNNLSSFVDFHHCIDKDKCKFRATQEIRQFFEYQSFRSFLARFFRVDCGLSDYIALKMKVFFIFSNSVLSIGISLLNVVLLHIV